MKRKTFLALAASAMLAVLAGLSACSKMDDPVLPEDDTMETVGFAEAHPLYEAREGDVVDTDGNAYTVTENQLLPFSVTPAGVLAFREYDPLRGRYDALIIALDDEASKMDWETAKGPNGAAAHTPAIADCEWKLPTLSDLEWMTGNYSFRDRWYFKQSLNKYIEKAGGTPLEGKYWTDTEWSNNNDDAWEILIDTISGAKCYEDVTLKTWEYKVRACIESDLRANIRSDQFVLSKKSLSFTAFTHTHSFTVSRPGNGKVTATSSNTDVAKVTVSNATGSTATVKVTVVADGTATITVKSDQTLYHNAYTNNDKTVSVTASGIKFERTTLAELKSWIKGLSNSDIDLPYDYLGRYVTSTGELSRSPEGAIGIVAYYANTDVEEGISDIQNILVLSVNDVSTGAAWWNSANVLIVKQSYGIASKNWWSENGYTNTKKLHEDWLGGWFAEAANLCWNMGVAISGEPTTQWFLPSIYQWDEIMMRPKGIGRGINDRSVTGMSTNSFYWSSTESDEYTAVVLGTDGEEFGCIKFYDKVHVRAVFAY